MYTHTKNCLIVSLSPGIIFGVSWYCVFRKKNHPWKSSTKKMPHFCIFFEKDYLTLSIWKILWKRNTMIPHNTRSIILQWDFLHIENFLFFKNIWKKKWENIYNWIYSIILVEVLKLQYCSCRIAETTTVGDEISTVAEL